MTSPARGMLTNATGAISSSLVGRTSTNQRSRHAAAVSTDAPAAWTRPRPAAVPVAPQPPRLAAERFGEQRQGDAEER